MNPNIQVTFRLLNQYVNAFKNQPSVPGSLKMIIEKIQWGFEYMGKVEVPQNQEQDGQQQQQGSGCNIF